MHDTLAIQANVTNVLGPSVNGGGGLGRVFFIFRVCPFSGGIQFIGKANRKSEKMPDSEDIAENRPGVSVRLKCRSGINGYFKNPREDSKICSDGKC